MNTAATPLFFLKEAARAFVLAMGQHKTALVPEITEGAHGLYIEAISSESVDTASHRAARCGRALADEAKRKGLRSFTKEAMPNGGAWCCFLEDRERGVAMRLIAQFSPAHGPLYRLTMLGSRRRVRAR